MATSCPFCGTELSTPEAQVCPACGRDLASHARGTTRLQDQAFLTVRIPGQPPRGVTLDQTTYTIGRRPENNIVLPVEGVSRNHGRLEHQAGSWQYTDLGSTNGTFVNGQRQQSSTLRDGDILRIGDPLGNTVSLTYRAGGRAEASAPAGDEQRIGATVLGMKSSLLIGRNPQADIPLASPIVSRNHARLDRTAQGHVLSDLTSTNGTFVNGQRVERPTTLQQGDVVQIGPFRLVYEADSLQQHTTVGGMRLDGLRLTREVGNKRRKKQILTDISLSIYPREFVALVGTSGAGKSTLLTALNGFTRAEGQVLVNGDNLYRHFDLYRTMIGYVPQENIVHQELTVASVLQYAAQLRLPPDTSREEIKQRIDWVLQQVEIVGQKDQVVSSLSGGQRKRVSIAVELLAEPNLFFLDEPTSGLDPGLEKKMMLTLRRLADGGQTVLLVTHATANIRQCDHVCFLAQGRLVYFGPPEEALQFFGVTSGDFADIYDRLDDPDPAQAKEKATQWEQRFRQSPQYRQYVVKRFQTLPKLREATGRSVPHRPPRVNQLRQFSVLSRRYLNLVLHDRLLLTILLSVMPAIGLLVLLLATPNALIGDTEAEIERQIAADLAAGAKSASYAIANRGERTLNSMSQAGVMLGLFAAAFEIVKERSIFRRERMVNLRLIPYVASKVFILTGFAAIQCFLFILVVALKVHLPKEGVFLPAPVEIYITLVLLTGTALMTGLFVSALVPRTSSVIYMVLLVLFFQFIFGGAIYQISGRIAGLSRLTMVRWANEALGTSADMEQLDTLTRTRIQPDPISQEFSMDIARPADDWQPVTVITTTREIGVPCIPGILTNVPITVPQVTVNELVTVTDTITKTFTLEPGPMDFPRGQGLSSDYSRTLSHLLEDWISLIGLGLVFGLGTVILLRRRGTQ